jgi:hypothetical protein
MATLKLVSNPLLSYDPPIFKVALISAVKTPEKIIETTKLPDISAALDAFAAELILTGKPWMVSTILKSGRAPHGYRQAQYKLRRFVNTDVIRKAVTQ